MDSLRSLSLGRNQIKKLENLEAVAPTLEELWVSYNLLERLVRSCAPKKYPPKLMPPLDDYHLHPHKPRKDEGKEDYPSPGASKAD